MPRLPLQQLFRSHTSQPLLNFRSSTLFTSILVSTSHARLPHSVFKLPKVAQIRTISAISTMAPQLDSYFKQ